MKKNSSKKPLSYVVLIIGLLFAVFRSIYTYHLLGYYSHSTFDFIFDVYLFLPYLLFFFFIPRWKFVNFSKGLFGATLMVLADLYFHYVGFTDSSSTIGILFIYTPLWIILLFWVGFFASKLFDKFYNK